MPLFAGYRIGEPRVMDERLQALRGWLQALLHTQNFSLEPASSDASFRRYFRIRTQEHSLIAMDAPPEREDSRPFVLVATRLLAAGLNVPKVIEADLQQGFLLLGDLGQHLYLQALQRNEGVRRLYHDAIEALVTMQSAVNTAELPPYDRTLLMREMGLFRDWLLTKHLGIEARDDLLQPVFEWLADRALSQPTVFVHRDYHSRNLMVCTGNNPGILDFQDAVSGPVSYDLVSLLKDCYVKWPRDRVAEWRHYYFVHAARAGILPESDRENFERNFDLMGVQRHLKAAGIFARLWHRDGKRGYLTDIPRTLSYILDCAPEYPELDGLAALISDEILPALDEAQAS